MRAFDVPQFLPWTAFGNNTGEMTLQKVVKRLKDVLFLLQGVFRLIKTSSVSYPKTSFVGQILNKTQDVL